MLECAAEFCHRQDCLVKFPANISSAFQSGTQTSWPSPFLTQVKFDRLFIASVEIFCRPETSGSSQSAISSQNQILDQSHLPEVRSLLHAFHDVHRSHSKISTFDLSRSFKPSKAPEWSSLPRTGQFARPSVRASSHNEIRALSPNSFTACH